MTEIQCLCGAVHVQLSAPPLAQFFCHCDDCQAVHCAAYVPISMYAADAVKVTRGSPPSWARKTMPRRTCQECGTRIFAQPPQLGISGVSGYLLPKGTFQPTFHIQCQYAVMPVRDDLPHFKGLPTRFGGSDEVVGW